MNNPANTGAHASAVSEEPGISADQSGLSSVDRLVLWATTALIAGLSLLALVAQLHFGELIYLKRIVASLAGCL